MESLKKMENKRVGATVVAVATAAKYGTFKTL
jgi:hypothetical protein